jgi:hypothetical protein
VEGTSRIKIFFKKSTMSREGGGVRGGGGRERERSNTASEIWGRKGKEMRWSGKDGGGENGENISRHTIYRYVTRERTKVLDGYGRKLDEAFGR